MGGDNRPEIGFGQIRHARLRGANNRFSYRAWFLRLPLRSLARRPAGLFWLRFNRRGIFSVNDADHGDGRPLLQWFDDLLRSEGVVDTRRDGKRIFYSVADPTVMRLLEVLYRLYCPKE